MEAIEEGSPAAQEVPAGAHDSVLGIHDHREFDATGLIVISAQTAALPCGTILRSSTRFSRRLGGGAWTVEELRERFQISCSRMSISPVPNCR